MSRIRDAVRLQAGWDHYVNTYLPSLATRQPQRRGPRGPRQILYVNPFGIDYEATELARTSSSVDSWTALQASVNTGGTRVVATLGANAEATPHGFSAARLIATQSSNQGVYEQSEKTGLYYLKYNNTESYRVPFGRSVATEQQYDAFTVIRDHVLANVLTLDIKSVSYTPERIYAS